MEDEILLTQRRLGEADEVEALAAVAVGSLISPIEDTVQILYTVPSYILRKEYQGIIEKKQNAVFIGCFQMHRKKKQLRGEADTQRSEKRSIVDRPVIPGYPTLFKNDLVTFYEDDMFLFYLWVFKIFYIQVLVLDVFMAHLSVKDVM
jgi:hypothetical protein